MTGTTKKQMKNILKLAKANAPESHVVIASDLFRVLKDVELLVRTNFHIVDGSLMHKTIQNALARAEISL